MSIIMQAAALLSQPPGSLVYQLVLLFALGAAAAVAVGRWWRWRDPAAARLALGAGVLFALHLALVVVEFLAALAVVDALVIIPPFDRAVSTLKLLVIIWLFAFPAPQRAADAGLGLLSILVGFALVVGWGLWSQQALAVGFFNASPQESAWELAQIGLTVAGAVVIAARREPDWRLALTLLALLLIGRIIHYNMPIGGANVAGAARLAEIAAAPLLLAAIYRRAHPDTATAAAPVDERSTVFAPLAPDAGDWATGDGDWATGDGTAAQSGAQLTPAMAQTLAALADPLQPDEFAKRAAAAVGRGLGAALTLYLAPASDLSELVPRAAYAAQGERFLEANFPLVRDAPESMAALLGGKTITWEPGTSERALHALAREAGLPGGAGALLLAPLSGSAGVLGGVAAIVASAGQTEWPAAQKSQMETLAQPLAAAWRAMDGRLTLAHALDNATAQLKQMHADLEHERENAQALTNQLQLQRRAETVHTDQISSLEDLQAELQAAEAEIERRQLQEQQLQADLDLVRADLTHVSQQATAAASRASETKETSVLLEALAAADARHSEQAAVLASVRRALAESERQRSAAELAAATASPGAAPRSVQAADVEVIASITQELRQPMSSIGGYADLLLSESVGIIGALQRKFLERIKASTERIGVLLDDLMRIMAIDSGKLTLSQESVDVQRVIDDAAHSCEALYQEKNLRLVRETAPNLPPIQADRDALLQIFMHLLNNAGAASANDSQVKLVANRETDQRPGGERVEYLVVSVTDSGPGIAPEDQSRVFSRIYRADAPLISGLGDNGVGLSVAKALVEAHGGRVWAISEPGAGSTLYALLPVAGKRHTAPAVRSV